MNNLYRKNLDESIRDYKLRICSYKEDECLTWQEIGDIISYELGIPYSGDAARCFYKAYKNKNISSDDNFTINPIDVAEALNEIKQLKVEIHDERVQNNSYIRALSREETLKQIGIEAAQIVAKENPLQFNDLVLSNKDSNSAILLLSDWHYGIETNSFWNKYNPEIAIERLKALYTKIVNTCQTHNVTTLNVLILGDLISGRIHSTIRMQNREDIISQTIHVSEYLATFLYELNKFFNINYYSCTDNHSRIEPNKKESLQLETMTRIIDWYLKERLKDTNICFKTNKYGEDIISFEFQGAKVAAVHGDKDKFSNIVKSINGITNEHFDVICSAHLHHFAINEENNTTVISNGSLMGTDDYAFSKRLHSMPSQTLIIGTALNPVEIIYPIKVF